MTAGLLLLRVETASLLFERGAYNFESAAMTGYALGFHVIGLTHIALGRVLVPVFYAFKDTRTPVLIAAMSMVVNLGLCYALAPYLSFGGIALANTVSAIAQAMALGWYLKRHTGSISDHTTLHSLVLSGLATLVMAGAVLVLKNYFDLGNLHGFRQLLVPYSIILAVAALAFFGICGLSRHPELHELRGLLRQKLNR